MNFIVEFAERGELAGKPLIALEQMSADTLPLAVRAVVKALDAGAADEAVIYMPIRVVRAARKVEVLDSNGRAVAVDAPAEYLEGRVKPLESPVPSNPTPIDVDSFQRP